VALAKFRDIGHSRVTEYEMGFNIVVLAAVRSRFVGINVSRAGDRDDQRLDITTVTAALE
jgi:hypothetical protein